MDWRSISPKQFNFYTATAAVGAITIFASVMVILLQALLLTKETST